MTAGERARVAALGQFTGEDEERVALRVQEARARVLEYEQGRRQVRGEWLRTLRDARAVGLSHGEIGKLAGMRPQSPWEALQQAERSA